MNVHEKYQLITELLRPNVMKVWDKFDTRRVYWIIPMLLIHTINLISLIKYKHSMLSSLVEISGIGSMLVGALQHAKGMDQVFSKPIRERVNTESANSIIKAGYFRLLKDYKKDLSKSDWEKFKQDIPKQAKILEAYINQHIIAAKASTELSDKKKREMILRFKDEIRYIRKKILDLNEKIKAKEAKAAEKESTAKR